MSTPESRYDFTSILLHWLVAFFIFAQFVVVWHIYDLPQDSTEWRFYFNLHLFIGLIVFLFAVIWIGWRLTHKAPAYPDSLSKGERFLAQIVYFFLYFCLLLLPVTGFLKLAYGPPVSFLGKTIYLWAEQNEELYELFNLLHKALFFILVSLLVVHLVGLVLQLFRCNGVFSRMFLSLRSKTTELMLPGFTGPSPKYKHTSLNFLVFGTLALLAQLLIAIVTILLLVFATSGNQPGPGGLSGNEASIFWAQCGIISLFVTIIFFYYTTRYAKKIKLKQDVELHAHKKRTLYLLRFGLLCGFIGIVISILGVGSSVELLIAKTISQPPGIAITDPSKIVRALDVFVLVINFAVVIAHFIGIVVSLWLLNRVDRNF